MTPLAVSGLCKTYPGFALQNVSFSLAPQKITGFIGRNGAGKTTTLRSIFNFVHPERGEIEFFDMKFAQHEKEIKSRIGFVTGAVDFYPHKKLRAISDVTKSFYSTWDENAYRQYMKQFRLEENKTPAQLSAGMKVKYSLALALSHGAELLILDEPTSGLDPVSRDALLEDFLNLCDAGKTILFSTHITSDLDKCADRILYMRNGKMTADADLQDFAASYRLVHFKPGALSGEQEAALLGVCRSKQGSSGLIGAGAESLFEEALPVNLEDIMVHLEKEAES